MGVEPDATLHEFSCVVVENDRPGLEWGPDCKGLGMRGNSSRSLTLNDVRVPARNLLGAHGDQLWYVFQVVAPFFLTAMSGTYLGIAQAAFDNVRQHLVKSSIRHGSFVLTVQDNGLGIPSRKQERVFQLFKRMHVHVQGSGVGLYIVKRIVSNSGGTVQVDSTENVGTTFTVALPVFQVSAK